jgi:HTH-type transcriptional regulator / antitoxin HipB
MNTNNIKESNDSKHQEKEDLAQPSKYNIELPLDKKIIGRVIKALRKIRKFSQTRLGRSIGVQKAQISKLENSGSNITLGTMLKVFTALRTKVTFRVELDRKKDLKTIEKALKEEEAKKNINPN